MLAARRKELNFSSRDVDFMVDCADGLVSKWECSYKKPSALMLLRWINALNLNIELDYDVLDRYQIKAVVTAHTESDRKRYPTAELMAFLKEHNARLVPK